ncbi:MAG: SH3 domain-containing protein [Clostridia bacterium]|nr:SH3 domain-containing protein [Clostridia bacterium]
MIKRLILFLCILLALLPLVVSAEDYAGNMEVVNCSEWVSMREAPSTKARRLVKVSLGSIVSNCYAFTDEWYYAEFDGYSGYILADYLKPSENETTFSAMLTLYCDGGVEVFPTISSEEIFDLLPENTIVRNCHVENNGRVYVEYGDQCGFVESDYVVAYNHLSHFPHQITLLTNLYDGSQNESVPALKIDSAEDFSLAAYDYSEYEQEEMDDTPLAEFVLHSDKTLNHVHLFNAELRDWDSDTGEAIYDATLENIQYQVDPEHPLMIRAVMYGDMPNLVVGYQDDAGYYHFTFVEISGEDGHFMLREF